MTNTIQVPDEVAILAGRRGLDVPSYIEQLLLKELAAEKPILPMFSPFNRLTQEELKSGDRPS